MPRKPIRTSEARFVFRFIAAFLGLQVCAAMFGAENAQDEQFGVDRLAAVVADNRSGSATAIHGCIRESLKQFVGDEPTHDDSTLLLLKFS